MAKHRSGKLKQHNKKHKIPGGTKGTKENRVQGRIAKAAPKKVHAGNSSAGGKQERLNRQKQLMQDKRLVTLAQKRLDSLTKATRIVSVLSLQNAAKCLGQFFSFLSESDQQTRIQYDEEQSLTQLTRIEVSSEKAQLTLLPLHTAHTLQCLDQLAVSDGVLLLLPLEGASSTTIDADALKLLPLLSNYSATNISLVLLSPASALAPPTKATRQLVDCLIAGALACLGEVKIFYPGERGVARGVYEHCGSKEPRWRTMRSYLLADEQTLEQRSGGQGAVVTVTGTLRGTPLYLHSLVHLSEGLGTGELLKVSVAPRRGQGEKRELQADGEKRDKLSDYLPPASELEGEQTWPGEGEMVMGGDDDDDEDEDVDEEGDGEGSEEEGDNEEEGEEEEQGEVDEEALYNAYFNSELKEEKKSKGKSKSKRGGGGSDEDAGEEEEGEEMDMGNESRQKEEEDETADQGGEDFVEVSPDLPARTRFARYRALKSFRNSFWHRRENLPAHWASVYAFEDFKAMQRGVGDEMDKARRAQQQELVGGKKKKSPAGRSRANSMEIVVEEGEGEEGGEEMGSEGAGGEEEKKGVWGDYIFPGYQVTLTIALPHCPSVPFLSAPLVVFGLHAGEYKQSCLHYSIHRCGAAEGVYNGKIKSKDVFLYHCGFRSFQGKGIFSEQNLNADKHKFFRYLPREGFSVVSVMGPVSLVPNDPLLLLRLVPGESAQGRYELVAAGQLQVADPDRIVLKRIVLTGQPIRVRKRFGVVKHMFYDPLDVKYFKPAELFTAQGLRGHITEALGTHGLYKALFSAPLSQNDQVQLSLYKRVYPKVPSADESASAGDMQ